MRNEAAVDQRPGVVSVCGAQARQYPGAIIPTSVETNLPLHLMMMLPMAARYSASGAITSSGSSFAELGKATLLAKERGNFSALAKQPAPAALL
jgi:hypothetical protein